MAANRTTRSERRTEKGVAPSASGHEKAGQEVTHLVIGQIVAPFGIRGELKVHIESDDPERFALLKKVFLGDALVRYNVISSRLHQGAALLRLEGVTDRNAAEALRGTYVYVEMEDALPLEEGEYYHHQILGLAVRTEGGEDLGRVTDILVTGANDVFVVQGPRGEVLLPSIADVILEVNLEAGAITVRIPEGLL